MHHLLIEGMVDLGHWDEFHILSALVSMVTHWIGTIISHDLRLSSNPDLTKLLHYITSQP